MTQSAVPTRRPSALLLACLSSLLLASPARAEEPVAAPPAPVQELAPPAPAAPPTSAPLATPPAPGAAPAPYSLPWGLRPIVPVTVIRLDLTQAFFHDKDGNLGATTVVLPTIGYRFTARFMGLARLAVTGHQPPTGDGAPSVSNPLLGGIYSFKLPGGVRLAAFLAATLPMGTGGDKGADPNAAAATQGGLWARAALDNALFAVNDFTVIPGVDLAYIGHGLTVQVEATVLQLMRVRGEAVQPDAFKTNFTAGLHVGYFLLPLLSLSAELRYQRWLSTPAAVAADASGTLRDNLSLAVGPRLHFKLGGTRWLRPGVSYGAGLTGALGDRGYHVLQVDLPFLF